jgi:hypothetical protein
LVEVNQTLKANKALESCKINGLLGLSLDANEHFHSRSRCCPCCCQREVQQTDAQGQKQTVIEYYHRYVFAQINGPKFNTLLDLEPIRPGEGEAGAAAELLQVGCSLLTLARRVGKGATCRANCALSSPGPCITS